MHVEGFERTRWGEMGEGGSQRRVDYRRYDTPSERGNRKGERDRCSVRARREGNAVGTRQARGARTRRRQASHSLETRIQERRRERGDETRMHGSHGIKSRFVRASRSWSVRERRTAGAARVVQRRDQTEKWARGCLPSGEGARWYLCPTGPTVRS